jgi:hypothetical protein
MILHFKCDETTNPHGNGNATEGEITVSGDYSASFNIVQAIYEDYSESYIGVIASESFIFIEDEYAFALYSGGLAVFTKRIGESEWLRYAAMNPDASYDVSDPCKPVLVANNSVLYQDSSYTAMNMWTYDPDNLDSGKTVIIDGEMSTDLRILGLCYN